MKNKLFNKIISIVLCVVTIILGALFILQCIRLNNNFTKTLITRVLMQISPVIILWAVCFVVSLFARAETKKFTPKPKYFTKKVSNKTYLIINIIYAILMIACVFFTVGYLVQSKHFTPEYTESMTSFAYYLLPFAIIAFIASFVRTIFVPTEEIKFIKLEQKKKVLVINIARVICLTVAIVLIVIGVVNRQMDSVLIKAINICMECVGIG